MRSVKRGRGPSFMGGVMCVFMGLFGLLWTIIVGSSGGGVFALFGVIFILIAVVNAVYEFSNATRKNRFSDYDVTDGDEEPDPFNERFGGGGTSEKAETSDARKGRFCPWCGARADDGYAYCNQCGKKLP